MSNVRERLKRLHRDLMEHNGNIMSKHIAPEDLMVPSDIVKEVNAIYSALEPVQDEEPVAWMKEDEDGDLEFNTLNQFSCGRTNGIPLFLRPAPRPEFVRLSEEEIMDLSRAEGESFRWPSSAISIARAIEDALEEKNK